MDSEQVSPSEPEPRHGLRMLLRNPVSLAGVSRYPYCQLWPTFSCSSSLI